jgi:hypothetical protein
MRRLNKSIAVEYKETKNHAWTHHHSEKKCMCKQKRRREDNLPIEQGVMNSYDRFYRAFVANLTKAEHTTSFFDKSARKLLWLKIFIIRCRVVY